LVGRSITEFVHPDDRAMVAARAHQVLVQGRPAAIAAERFVRLDGQIVDVEVVSLPITFAGERAAQVVARDVTALKRAADRAGRLQAVATALAGASTPAQVGRIVVEQASSALGARAGALLRLVEQDGWFEVLHQTGYAAETPETARVMREYRRFPASLSTPVADAVRTGLVVSLESGAARAARYPHLAGVQAMVGAGAALAVPLVAEGRALGALHLTFAAERELSDDDRSFLETMAAQCAVALERARLFEVEREAHASAEAARARMALLAEASRLFAAAGPDIQAVLDLLLERACTVVGEAGVIRVLREDGPWLDLAAVRHPDPEVQAMLRSPPLSDPTPLGAGATGQAVASGRPVVAASIEPGVVPTIAPPAYAEYLRRFPPRSAVSVPMRARDRVVGALAMSRSEPDRPYGDEEIALLQDLADRGALAVDNARLVAASSRVAARMERLQTITGELGRSLTPETVLQQVTDAAALLLEASVTAVFLLGGPEEDFVLAAVRGVDAARAGGLRLPRRTSLAGRAIDEGRTLIVNDVRTDPGTALPALLGETAGAEIAAPILGAEGALGVVKVFSPAPRTFTAEDADLLDALAAAAAVAITNARLYRAAQESVRARDAFLSVAAHELKTPTTAVLAGAQLLVRRSVHGRLVAESVERHASVIADSAKRLGRLVDDLLDVSRVRTGQLALRLIPTDVTELARRVAARYRDQIDQTHDLVLELAPTTCLVRADPDRLEQVIENLLDNALKYSPEGGRVELAVGVADGQLRLQVRDEGIGLPPGSAERIFEPFERAPNAATRQLPGMGLGLHICRNIVELHGGRMEAQSPGENRGTTVSVWLPCADDEDG
ncbi:MAG TPA: GAF domain-containing protein, partial [Chloroflexota bacterium]